MPPPSPSHAIRSHGRLVEDLHVEGDERGRVPLAPELAQRPRRQNCGRPQGGLDAHEDLSDPGLASHCHPPGPGEVLRGADGHVPLVGKQRWPPTLQGSPLGSLFLL
eukprot:8094714-Pyramimonas_sp.AAC.1